MGASPNESDALNSAAMNDVRARANHTRGPRARFQVNARARAAADAPDFSRRIRAF